MPQSYIHQPRPDRFAGTGLFLYQVARMGPLWCGCCLTRVSLLVNYRPTFLFFSGQYSVLLYAICAGAVVLVLLKSRSGRLQVLCLRGALRVLASGSPYL